MNVWKGVFAAVASFLLLWQFGPRPAACVLADPVGEASPLPTRDMARLERGSSVSRDVASPVPDPFALEPVVAIPPSHAIASRPVGAPPPRPWRATGLVGRRAAVLVGPHETSVVVSVGQRIDSAVVVGISDAGVELEDRGGRFLLKVR